MSRAGRTIWLLSCCLAALAPRDAVAQDAETPRVDRGEPDERGEPEFGDDFDAPEDDPIDTERRGSGAASALGDPTLPLHDEDRDEEDRLAAQGEEIDVRAALGHGVTIDAGETFALQIRARVQFQIALTHASDGAIAAGADEHFGIEFQMRRVRLVLAGHALTRDLRYYIQLGFSPRDMERDLLVPVRDAYLTWQFHRDIGLRFGQMKVPFGAQRVTSSSAQQLVDRSTVVAELNLDRDIGFYLMSEDLGGLGGVLQYQLGVFGGRGRNRFGGLDSALLAGRVLVCPFGAFDHLSEGDHSRSARPRLAIGVSTAYNIDSNRTRSTHENVLRVARFDFLHLGADVHFKWSGLTFLAEAMFREASEPSATGTIDGETITEYSRSGWGWFAQVGYMLPWFDLEIVARYGEIRPLDSNAPEARFFLQHEVGGGLGYYFQEHALKVQADYFYYFGADPVAERHQVRVQAQLYF